jgi:hypothetical protein
MCVVPHVHVMAGPLSNLVDRGRTRACSSSSSACRTCFFSLVRDLKSKKPEF